MCIRDRDVSVKATSVCIVDETGKIVREVKVASEPEGLLAAVSYTHLDVYKRQPMYLPFCAFMEARMAASACASFGSRS